MYAKVHRLTCSLLLTVAMLALLAAACAPSASAPAGTTGQSTAKPAADAKSSSCSTPIKVGVLYSVSGGLAIAGRTDRDGAQLAADLTNASGGINGCQIEVVAYDSESDAEKGTTLAKKMIEQDKVVGIIGPESVQIHAPIAALAAQSKVPNIANSGAFQSLKPETMAYSFTTTPAPHTMTTSIWPFFKSLGVKNWAYMATPDPSGNSSLDTGQRIAKALGLELVGDERQPITDKDMTPSLAKLKAKNPQGLVVIGTGDWGVIAVNNAAQIGLNIPVLYAGGYTWEAFQKGLTPEAIKNLHIVTAKLDVFDQMKADDPARATIMKFVDAFKAKYGKDPEMFSGAGYDAMQQMIDALKAVGPDREKIKGYLETMKNWQGVTGSVFNRAANNHNGQRMDDAVVVKMEGVKKSLVGSMSDILKKLTSDETKQLESLRAEKPLEY